MRPKLVRQDAPPGEEGVAERVSAEVRDPGGVDVGEAEQPPREVGRVLVRPEDGPEARVAALLQEAPGEKRVESFEGTNAF